jgi:hypothetical protein
MHSKSYNMYDAISYQRKLKRRRNASSAVRDVNMRENFFQVGPNIYIRAVLLACFHNYDFLRKL